MKAAWSPSGWQQESWWGCVGGEQGLGCRCQVSSLQGAEGALLPLPRAVQSSAGSADTQVPALLLPVHHTLGFVVTQSCALAFGAWQVGCSKRGFWEAGSCQLLVGEDSVYLHSLAFSSIPQLWSGERADTSRIFYLP